MGRSYCWNSSLWRNKEFRANRREMGHIHGNSLVDFPFPVQLRKELVFSGKVSLHHVLPESGWASYWIKSDTDFKEIIELFRIQYERLKPKEQSSVSTSNHQKVVAN
jgi:hypothetical protein